MDVKQALVALFGESPLNWAKWAVVFAVLVDALAKAHASDLEDGSGSTTPISKSPQPRR